MTHRAAKTDGFVNPDSTFVKWSSSLKQHLERLVRAEYDGNRIVRGSYRPFDHEYVYFERILNHRRGSLEAMFPTANHENLGIYVVGSGSDVPFSALMLDQLPNLHVTGAGSGGQFFPRWTYTKANPDDGGFDFGSEAGEIDEYGYRRVDNITGAIVELYEQAIGVPVTRDDIFYFVYGLLHDPAYRNTYAADLRKMLPHIPTPSSRDRFEYLAAAGRALADLHVNFGSVDPYPLDVQLKLGADPADRETWRVAKMKWKTKGDYSTIVYNLKVSITGIPKDAERYQVGSRSALAWIIDRYQRKVDKASGIVNDANDWCDEQDDPQYVVNLIRRVTTVATAVSRSIRAVSRR